MKVFKIALFATAVIGLCSFVWMQSSNEQPPIDKKVYQKFLNKFKKVDMPYQLTMDKPTTIEDYDTREARKIEVNNYLGSEFGEIIPAIQRGMYSRMGPDDFEAESMLAKHKHFDAVIYSRSRSFRSGKTYYVATFDKEGKMISQQAIAGSYRGMLQDAEISKDLAIRVAEYNINTEDENNLAYTLANSEEFMINPSGEIVQITKKAPVQEPIQQIQLDESLGMK